MSLTWKIKHIEATAPTAASLYTAENCKANRQRDENRKFLRSKNPSFMSRRGFRLPA